MKHFALQLLIIILVTISAIECQRWAASYNRPSSNNSKQSGRSSAYINDNGNNRSTEANIPAKSQQKSTSRHGIGAWGIVAITLTIILSGLGVYYFVIFYPIVCKKERMYDVMEMTTV